MVDENQLGVFTVRGTEPEPGSGPERSGSRDSTSRHPPPSSPQNLLALALVALLFVYHYIAAPALQP